MRILPHSTSEAAVWHDVDVVIDGTSGATSWDYTSQMSISTSVEVDVARFLSDTGLASLRDTSAVLMVDCSSTGRRFVEQVTMEVPCASLTVDIPPGVVAKSLSVSRAIVLSRNRESAWRVASRVGDRLNEAEATTVSLEGSGGRFPVDAIDFASNGLPSTALWNLKFQPEGWDDLYLGTVRLRVNTSHPASDALLRQRHADHHAFVSVLRVDMIVQMLVSMLPRADELDTTTDDPDSVAGVLDGIVQTYAGIDLPTALARARDELPDLVSILQSNTLYLTRKP